MIVAIRNMFNDVSNKTFLCDVKCSKSLTDEIEKLGGKVYMSRTGTSFTEANTKKMNIPLGGELSGHIFFNDRGPEVCSAIYTKGPAVIGEFTQFLGKWMERKGMESVQSFRGRLNAGSPDKVNTFERTQFLKYYSSKE